MKSTERFLGATNEHNKSFKLHVVQLTNSFNKLYHTVCGAVLNSAGVVQLYLVGCRVPAHDSLAEGMAVPHALNDDIQEAIVLASGVAQAHGGAGGRLMGGALPHQLSGIGCLLLL